MRRVCTADILTFIILYNNLIPISLIVTIEVVRLQHAALISADLDMYYELRDTPAVVRTSSLVEDLGRVEFVFADKTGTLTRNEMVFRAVSIGGVAYMEEVDEAHSSDEDGREVWRTFGDLRALLEGSVESDTGIDPFLANGEEDRSRATAVAREFMSLLAVCHTVIPEVRDGKTHYQASSPDEVALVAGADLLGYQFHVRIFCSFVTVSLTPFVRPVCLAYLAIVIYRCANRALYLSISVVPLSSTKSSTCVNLTPLASACQPSFAPPMARSSCIAKVLTRLFLSDLASIRRLLRKRLHISRY